MFFFGFFPFALIRQLPIFLYPTESLNWNQGNHAKE